MSFLGEVREHTCVREGGKREPALPDHSQSSFRKENECKLRTWKLVLCPLCVPEYSWESLCHRRTSPNLTAADLDDLREVLPHDKFFQITGLSTVQKGTKS
jgi:hypothetical protein